MKEKIRNILRDFWNDSYYESEGEQFVPHAGDDPNCKLCQIEKQAINKISELIKNLTKHNPISTTQILNNGQMMAQLLKQEIYCESGKLKHLIKDKKVKKFIEKLQITMNLKQKLKDIIFGKQCPKCKDGKLTIYNVGTKGHSCWNCGYDEKGEPSGRKV